MAAMTAILDFRSKQFKQLFRSTSDPNVSYQVSSQMTFPQFRRRSEKQILKMAVMAANLDFW